jgi:soluble lytic murein transglycosylase-like protein
LANRYGLDENLVKAIVSVESNYNPLAISPKGCKGLMQLHPDTAQRFGVRDIFDPAENIEGGIKYLRFLINYFNQDLQLVLAAYNAGENAVSRYGGIPPYRETRDYVKKVWALYDRSSQPALETWLQDYHVYRLVLPGGGILFTNTPRLTGLN